MLLKLHQMSHRIGDKIAAPSLLISRIVLAFVFAGSGWWKLANLEQAIGFFEKLNIPLASLQAPFVGVVELVGGILIGIGFMTRMISLPLLFTMIVALATAHAGEITGIKALFSQSPFLYLIMLLVHIGVGAGCISLDHKIFHKK